MEPIRNGLKWRVLRRCDLQTLPRTSSGKQPARIASGQLQSPALGLPSRVCTTPLCALHIYLPFQPMLMSTIRVTFAICGDSGFELRAISLLAVLRYLRALSVAITALLQQIFEGFTSRVLFWLMVAQVERRGAQEGQPPSRQGFWPSARQLCR